MMQLDKEIEITDELLYRVLLHFKKYGTDYAKSLGRDLDLNKRDSGKILKLVFEKGYLDKREGGGMLKRKDAKLKRRVTTHPHHTYYVLSEKGALFLKHLEEKDHL
jgi:predicted transcriptional regulator